MKAYDLVVGGAGPAGLTLAWRAAESGLRVLVFDKKKDAGHIAYTTSASLLDLERWQLPDDVAHSISHVHFASEGEHVELSIPACVLRRRRLLAELEKKCLTHSVDVAYGTYAKEIRVRHESIESIRFCDGTEVQGEVCADCSGLGNVFNRALPVNTTQAVRALGYEIIVPLRTEPQTVDLYMGRILEGGYGWLFPLSDEHAIVGVGILKNEDFRWIRDLLDSFLNLPRIAARVEKNPIETHAGVFNTGKPLKTFHRGNLVIVGDVALQGNPIAGEGIRFVMDAAEMAAHAAVSAVQSRDLGLLAEYSRTWTDTYYRKFSVNFKLQRFLYWLTGRTKVLDFMIRSASKASNETILTLIRGEGSPGFLLRKFPKLLTKQFA
jgi:digeranylgeranylglycerophospholipid reductase